MWYQCKVMWTRTPVITYKVTGILVLHTIRAILYDKMEAQVLVYESDHAMIIAKHCYLYNALFTNLTGSCALSAVVSNATFFFFFGLSYLCFMSYISLLCL